MDIAYQKRMSFPLNTSFRLALAGLSLLAFFPTFFNEFQLQWDDTWQVLNNPYVHDNSFENILFHFTHFWERQYSPVNTLFYILIVKLFGFNPAAFHAACLLVHVLSVLLTFEVIREAVKALLPDLSPERAEAYAFFTALIFAIYPLQVESVAWISASKIILYAFFALIALRGYIRYIHYGKWIGLGGVALAYMVSFASKEQAIILPLNLLLFDYIWHRFDGLTWRKALLSRVILEKIPFLLLAFGFWYFSWINGTGSIIDRPGGYPFYQRLVFASYSLVEYIFLFLAPAKLYFLHPFPVSPGEPLPLYFWGYIPLLGIAGHYVWSLYRKGNRLVLACFLFFGINLLLVLHLVPLPRTVIIADRYMYLSTIGLALILVWQLDQWLSRPTRSFKASLIAGTLVWLLFLAGHTYIRTQDWKDSDTAKASVNELIEAKQQAEEINSPFNLIENE